MGALFACFVYYRLMGVLFVGLVSRVSFVGWVVMVCLVCCVVCRCFYLLLILAGGL